jgi:galactokinase/mevalonate kinase-like predicted kinase
MTGIAFPGTPEQGSRHGVYIRARDGHVADFLQKPDLETAQRRKALDDRGRMLIDSGVLALDAATVESWLGAAGIYISGTRITAGAGLVNHVLRGRAGIIDLYQEILCAAAWLRTPPTIATGIPTESPAAVSRLYAAANRTEFWVATVPDCDFLHIGSSGELLALVGPDLRLTDASLTRGRVTVFNSSVKGRVKAAGRVIVESSKVEGAATFGGRNLLVGFPGGAPVRLPRGWGMVFLPIGERDWSCVAFGIDDTFKTAWSSGGTLGGRPVLSWMERADLSPHDLFPATSDQTLWSARLWFIGNARRAFAHVQPLFAVGTRPPRGWLAGPRFSLAQLIPRVNHTRLIEHRGLLSRSNRFARAISDLRRGTTPPLAAYDDIIESPAHARKSLKALERGLLLPAPPFQAARLFRAADAIVRRYPHAVSSIAGVPAARLDSAAFACIAEGVARETPTPSRPPRAGIGLGQTVHVTSPVRIDLAGGWSDTPPICHEMGGSVVNAAISLDGMHPICVSARLMTEPEIRLTSTDLRRTLVISTTRAARDYSDPKDWAALPKAALALAGITPMDERGSLMRRLDRLGGGLELTMSAALPKGSGLGTSSILGAAVLACLDGVCGRKPNIPSLMRRTSLLEQMMSTAGGWQDQAGGITPGIKLVRTRAGPRQVPTIQPISPPPRALAELKERAILYYTGRRRLARNILRGVVGRYLSGEPAVIDIVHRLKAAAHGMAADLARGDIDAFARGVLRNWELKKAIDPGATNRWIESVFAPLVPLLTGYELPGAGGGGYLFLIARSPSAAKRVRAMLKRNPAGALARFYEFDIDTRGLTVEHR